MKLRIIQPIKANNRIMPYRTLAVNRKTGRFTFNVKAVEEMGLNKGYRVALARDEDTRADWYFTFDTEGMTSNKVNIRHSLPTRRQSHVGEFANGNAARQILDEISASTSATFIIASKGIEQDGRTWYRIITNRPIRKV